MKFVIVGYGIQGKKREKILGKSCVEEHNLLT